MKWIKENWFKAGILLILALGVSGYLDHLADVRAERENMRTQERSDQLANEFSFNKCIRDANALYHTNWNLACEGEGKEENCTLPRYLAEGHNEDLAEAEEQCAKLYK